jgi:methionyl-tRNA formyltransferase
MAPVPEYRGANQFSFAILDRSPLFGTTLHVMSEAIDSGDILFENRFAIDPDAETAMSLYGKTLAASKDLFVSSWPKLVAGDIHPVKQSSLTDRTRGFHLKSEINDIKEVDLAWSEEQRDRHVRACWFPPFPPPYAVVDGQKIELTLNRAEDPKA